VRKAEEVKGGAGSEDGGSVELSRSVEEEMGKDFSKDVFVEGEERERIHLRSCRVKRWEIEKGRVGVDDGSQKGRR